MHHSRLCAVLIERKTADVDEAAHFWAAALGRPVDLDHPMSRDNYRMLATPTDEPIVQIQRIGHERPTTFPPRCASLKGWARRWWIAPSAGSSCRRRPAIASALCGYTARASLRTPTAGIRPRVELAVVTDTGTGMTAGQAVRGVQPGRCHDRAALRRHGARPCYLPQARAHDGRRPDRDERAGERVGVYGAHAGQPGYLDLLVQPDRGRPAK